MTDKILLFGANGNLGSVVKSLYPCCLDISLRKIINAHDGVAGRAIIESLTRQYILEQQCSAVVYLGGLSQIDACFLDPNKSMLLNVDLPCWIWPVAQTIGASFIYASSEYVYGGAPGTVYSEESVCEPTTVYGRHKLLAEQRLRGISEQGLVILRLGKGIDVTLQRPSIITGALNSVSRGEGIYAAEDQFFNPFSAASLIKIISKILTRESVGVYNVGSPKPISRYALLRCFLSQLGCSELLQKCKLSDVLTLNEPRPTNLSMDSRKLYHELGFELIDAERLAVTAASNVRFLDQSWR
jgi:dTDP-4-dehydrorhamnose reductase